jgi:hypothetical protein
MADVQARTLAQLKAHCAYCVAGKVLRNAQRQVQPAAHERLGDVTNRECSKSVHADLQDVQPKRLHEERLARAQREALSPTRSVQSTQYCVGD